MPAVSGCVRGVLQRLGARGGAVGRQPGRAGRVHPVEHQAGQRHPLLAEPLDEVGRLAQRVALRGGHHDEGRAARLQQR